MNGKWQYRVVELKPRFTGFRSADIEQELNRLGQQGWELVHVVQGTVVLLYMKKEQ